MYLSYPALYTHIKTKHDGIPMAGTNAPQFRNNRRGRGRPRKTKETTVATKKREAHPADNIRNNPNFADEVSFAREMGYLVAGSETDPLIFFPMIYVNNERLEHPIRTKLEEMIASQIEIDGSIESVFAEFLYVRYKFTAAKLYKSFISRFKTKTNFWYFYTCTTFQSNYRLKITQYGSEFVIYESVLFGL